ncbi:hypothetical protein BHE74_00005152 [Ensete ventricosum]|nr:hypothetical protein GW17_00023751 [Ensete ventricosum]RWW86090.1 hypothetical protein BHE74_00005152 [Ensete ventricosum]
MDSILFCCRKEGIQSKSVKGELLCWRQKQQNQQAQAHLNFKFRSGKKKFLHGSGIKASKVISAKSGNDYESNYPSYFNTGYTFNVVGGLSQLIVQRECLVSRLVREVLPARGSV